MSFLVKFGELFTVNNTGLLVTLFSFASIWVIFSSCVVTLINCVLVVMTTLNLKKIYIVKCNCGLILYLHVSVILGIVNSFNIFSLYSVFCFLVFNLLFKNLNYSDRQHSVSQHLKQLFLEKF